jgi:hypothetical protein
MFTSGLFPTPLCELRHCFALIHLLNLKVNVFNGCEMEV